MSQILRPDTILARGNWRDQSDGTSNIHEAIDEVTPSSADYVYDTARIVQIPGEPLEPVDTTTIKIGLSEPAEEPDYSGTCTLRITHKKVGSIPVTATVYLYQGSTNILQKSVSMSTSEITTSWVLTTAQKALITTGGDFRVWVKGTPSGSTKGNVTVQVIQTEFQVPDAASGGGGEDPPAPPAGGSSPDQRDLKVWTINVDGHHFYILNLGDYGTLIFDTLTRQWSEWQSKDENRWVPACGINWGAEVIAGHYNSNKLMNVKVGSGYDFGTDAIVRVVRGLLPMRTRVAAPCNAVYLTGSALRGAVLTLKTSDDGGKTFTSHEQLNIN